MSRTVEMPLWRKLALQKFGTQTAFAQKLGITRQALSQWDVHVPRRQVLRCCELFDHKVTPTTLNPNFFYDQ